jgi:hypothetical protein
MIKKEAVGAKPFYRPGDIVTNVYGDKGVIVKAEVITHEGKYDWRDEVPLPHIDNGWRPKYAIEWFVNSQGGADYKENKYAWWEAHEWADVELGLTHSKQEKRNENHDG